MLLDHVMSGQPGPLSSGAARISPALRFPIAQFLSQSLSSVHLCVLPPSKSFPFHIPVQVFGLCLLYPLGLKWGTWDPQLGPQKTSYQASQDSGSVLLAARAILTLVVTGDEGCSLG